MWLSDRGGIAMRAKQLITIAVATMLLIGGAAALGAASPGDQANDNATDAYDENAPDDVGADDAADASDDRAGNADGVGPSDGLPEQVPDHVSQIHETIESFLSGEVDNLGDALSEFLSGGEQANEAADDAEENADDGDVNDEDADNDDEDAGDA